MREELRGEPEGGKERAAQSCLWAALRKMLLLGLQLLRLALAVA